jgi:hypothetical protein
MSIFTGRELEFLASLNSSWRRLYFTELARLLEEDERRCGDDERRQRKPRWLARTNCVVARDKSA